MIVSESWNWVQANRAQRNNEAFRGHVTDVIGSLAGPTGLPQAFLVEQEPNWTLRTHFHLQNQFQVVVAGSGKLGRHELAPYMVHYTTPESGYGPIVSGDKGLSYFTIRERGGRGAHYLPEARGEMQPGLPKMQTTSDSAGQADAAELKGLSAQRTQPMVEADASGMGAWMLYVPPGAAVAMPQHANSGGRFNLVCAGSLGSGDATVERMGMFHLAPEESGAWQGRAGDGGLQLLVLQFPAKLNS